MPRLVVLAAGLLVVVALASGCGAAACRDRIGCHITPNGVNGVRPGQSPREVQRRWRVALKTQEVVLGSDSDEYGAICNGAIRGWARFWGPNGGPFSLEEIHFVAGAQTAVGIRVGSSRDAVRAAYGSAALKRNHTDELMVLGQPLRRYSAPPRARPALVFHFGGGKVDEIIFGWRDGISAVPRSRAALAPCG